MKERLAREYIRAITTEGWIFVVGFRVFDVGLLVLWLVWFFRLRDDDDDTGGDDDAGGGGPDTGGPGGDTGGGGGLRKRRLPGGRRLRDGEPPRALPRQRGGQPLRGPLPARVRQPAPPVPARR